MTVKELVSVLKNARTIVIGYGANAVPFDKDDPLVLDAYGDYIVDAVCADSGDYYEINIAMRPVKAGEEW